MMKLNDYFVKFASFIFSSIFSTGPLVDDGKIENNLWSTNTHLDP